MLQSGGWSSVDPGMKEAKRFSTGVRPSPVQTDSEHAMLCSPTFSFGNFPQAAGWCNTLQFVMINQKSAIHTESLPGDVPGLSWPSCPQQLEPHVYTLPSCRRNIECCHPQATSLSPLPLNTWQFFGSNVGFLSIPVPNCPSFAFPQHSMMTRGRGERGWAPIRRGRDSDGQMEEDRICSGLRAAPLSPLHVTSNPGRNKVQMNHVVFLHVWTHTDHCVNT